MGTVKSVFCPEFTLDTSDSNTWRHREAGADLVCVKGKKETDILLPADVSGDFYEKLPVDYPHTGRRSMNLCAQNHLCT